MGKYQARRKPDTPRRDTVNPVMRGIGCLFMVIVPIFAYFLGRTLAENNVGAGLLPDSWYGLMEFPDAIYSFSGLSVVANYLSTIPRLPATLTFAVIIIIVVGGIVSIVFGYMYNLMAPSKYGPFDVPPPRVKTKKYKR